MMTHDLLKRAEHYKATITLPGGGQLVGLIDDDTISTTLGVNLNEQPLMGGGLIGMLDKASPGLGKAIESMGGQGLAASSASYHLKKPASWQNPQLSFKVTFFDGIDGMTYAGFHSALSKAALPEKTSGFLHNAGMDLAAWGAIMGSAAINSIDAFEKYAVAATGSITLGKWFSSKGWWLTEASVSTHNLVSKSGKPVVWECQFGFQYYRQIQYNDWASFFIA